MDLNYCGSCGVKLPSKNAKICIKCGSDPRISASNCPSCGETLKSKNAKICIKCGAGLRGGSGAIGDKDPGIAALISVVCMLLLGAPAAGYFYIGKVKKGLVYLVLNWIFLGFVIFAYFLGALTYIGLFCCLPLLFVPLIVDIVIVYDVYLDAKGEKTILPPILED